MKSLEILEVIQCYLIRTIPVFFRENTGHLRTKRPLASEVKKVFVNLSKVFLPNLFLSDLVFGRNRIKNKLLKSKVGFK